MFANFADFYSAGVDSRDETEDRADACVELGSFVSFSPLLFYF